MDLEHIGSEKSNIHGTDIDDLGRGVLYARSRRQVEALIKDSAAQHALHPGSVNTADFILCAAAYSSEKRNGNKSCSQKRTVRLLQEAVQDQW